MPALFSVAINFLIYSCICPLKRRFAIYDCGWRRSVIGAAAAKDFQLGLTQPIVGISSGIEADTPQA